jgi:hypothetical protein
MARHQEHWSEERLSLDMQTQGGGAAEQMRAAATFEAIFKLRDAVDRNARASDAFAKSIRTLTGWLLVFTILIAVLTSVLAWDV